MFSKAQKLSIVDPEIALQVTQEVKRQEDHIELIASENYTNIESHKYIIESGASSNRKLISNVLLSY